MGALYLNKCYVATIDAVDAFFLDKGLSFTSGATSYQSWHEKSVANVWQIKRQSISSTGVITNLTTSNATVPTFPACDPNMGLTDGLAVGWLVATALIIVVAYKNMTKGAR